jgi:2-polyprenyl-3-methyl-5-hydroxy-6-metoxy-1,4-benzoquinol methylase
MVHVPLDAKDVLDIGCANGLFGELLKERQGCVVTGVEQDTELVNIAGARLDNVISGNIEEIIDRGILGRFDCILCGDVLEHLNNPWKVVGGLKRHLKKGGLFIASVPNIANWAIIYEMLKGRWDYVPFSILSGTHIRFFTRESLKELFEDAGYRIREIYFQGFEVPAEGAEFIGVLKKNLPEINVEELKASEIIIVAKRE